MDDLINPVIPEPPRKKSFTWLLILILFLLVAGLSFFAWESYRLKNQLAQTIQSPSPQISPSPVADPTAGWQKFTYPTFEFKLPPDWFVDSSGGTNPLQFENYNPENAPGRSFEPNEDKGLLKLEIFSAAEGLSLRDFINRQKANAVGICGEDINWVETPAILSGEPAIKVAGSFPGFWIAVFDPGIKRVRQIAFGLDFANNQELAEQILATFIFIE